MKFDKYKYPSPGLILLWVGTAMVVIACVGGMAMAFAVMYRALTGGFCA